MPNLKATVGARLKMLRKARRLTQEELGRAVSVDYKHIGAIERGLRAPSFDVLERLANAMGVEHYELLLPLQNKRLDLGADLSAVMATMTKAQRTTIQGLLTEILRAAKKFDPK